MKAVYRLSKAWVMARGDISTIFLRYSYNSPTILSTDFSRIKVFELKFLSKMDIKSIGNGTRLLNKEVVSFLTVDIKVLVSLVLGLPLSSLFSNILNN